MIFPSRLVSGLFFAATLFCVSCTSAGLAPYTPDGQDTAATTDDTGTDEVPSTDDSAADDSAATDSGSASGCDSDEIEDCTGACLPADWLGDGLCQTRFDCAALSFDQGDCAQDTDTGTAPAGCPSGQVEDCNGVCGNRTLLGNGACDARFDCAAHGYDDGDCTDTGTDTGTGGGTGTGGCPAGEIEDCTGGCVPDWWPGDGFCDPELDCAAHGNDDGDCATTGGGGSTCPAGTIEGCDGSCVDEAWLGDLYCDGALDCAATGYDDGDCWSCWPDEVIDCDGGCTPAEYWGDGLCDDSLDCGTWAYDGDDCAAGGSACPAGYVEGCDGSCVPESWVGDYYCDAALDCAETDYDYGDCYSCWPDEVIDCDGGCTPADWLGDAVCDLELYCSYWAYDYGDCD